MAREKSLAVALSVLLLCILGCISIEVVPAEETPIRTVVVFDTTTRTPRGTSATATAVESPVATLAPSAPVEPSIQQVFFATGVSGGSEPAGVATDFPDGTTKVYAFAAYTGMSDGLTCQSLWYANGQEIARTSFDWALGQTGETWVDFLEADAGLSTGLYNWELLVEGELLSGGTFSVGTSAQVTPPSPATSTPVRVTGPRIVFVSLRDRNNEIYVMNADGSGVVRLTNNSDIDYDPACSPDGTRIAFMSRRDGNNEIYVMNSGGSGVTRLTNHGAEDWDPAWSLDGSRIAFVSDRAGNAEIYIMNSTGGSVTRVTDNEISDRWPSWSPDGNHIVLTSPRDGNDELMIKDLLAGPMTRLTDNQANDWDPTWSPDGSRIAFVSNRDGNEEIYVMNAGGGGVTRLTNNGEPDISPAWSPDSARLAYVSYSGTNGDIYVMNADGSAATRITNNQADDWDPSWCAR